MAKKKTKIHHDHIAEGLRTLAVDITTLRQDPANARLHNDQNIESIMSSLSKFGQRKPVVVNKRDGIVEAGNGTLQAAKSLGWSHVAAVFVDDDPATATGFAIADNRTAELATWDEETLAKLLNSIEDEMPAIELGFSDEQLAEIMAPLNEDPIGEDVEPTEPPKEPVSQRGEVFELGPHRLMCGDSTSKEDVAALLCGEKADAVITDPPYGIGYDSNHESMDGSKNVHLGLVGDEGVEPLFSKVISETLKSGGAALIGSRWDVFHEWSSNLKASGLKVKSLIVWLKSNHGMGDLSGEYGRKWECVLFAHDGSFRFPGKRPVDVWDIGSLFSMGHRNHPTEKPVSWSEMGMSEVTKKEDLILDPFLGSGTTLIAAARQGRKCYGMEISPAYCDVIRKRWGDYAKENGLEAGSGAL